MNVNDLFAKRKGKFITNTHSEHNYPIAPNILNQDFSVSRPNQVWVSDITYIGIGQGWMYLTVVIDLFHQKVVGWSMGRTLSTRETFIPAWNTAIRSNNITKELIFH